MAESRPPLFSIVTVTLNPGPALQRTADSLALQTFGDFEHIVKDGGSRDGSVNALRTPYRAKVSTMEDAGIYDAMNQSLELCSGRFVQFLNAGDVLAGPGVLAEVARHVERNPECYLFYCDYVNTSTGLRSAVPERASAFHLYRRPICHQAWFVARSCLERVGGFDTRYELCADHDFFVRAVVVNRMTARRVPVTGVLYEGGGASGSRASQRTVLREYAQIRARHFRCRERLLYGSAVGLTAPGVRRWIASGRFGALYVAVLNGTRRARP